MSKKADCCGKFRKKKELVGILGEGNESWLECCYCVSDYDYEIYFKKELGERCEKS